MDNEKVKIIVTVGPASDSEAVLKKLILNGVNTFRLNFSHGSPEYFSRVIRIIRDLRSRLNKNVSIFLDLPGPKIRTGILPNGKLNILENKKYTLGLNGDIPVLGGVLSGIPLKGKISLSDGKIELKPIKRVKNGLLAKALNSGLLLNNQSLNADGLNYEKTYPTEKDRAGIKFGLNQGITTFALSFVSKKEDITNVRKLVGKDSILIAKIERESALNNFDGIAGVSNVIMIARGDLGLNIDIVRLPLVQRKLIREANKRSIPVITATQVLESMISNPIPTRAEVSDAFMAIMDGTDAIMLSEETAIGDYPVKAVDTLRRLIDFNYKKLAPSRYKIGSEEDALIDEVASLSENTKIRNIVIQTEDGKNAFRLSRYHTDANIFAITKKANIADLLTFGRNVIPILAQDIHTGLKIIKRNYSVDKAIIVYDVPQGKKSKSSIEILKI